MEFFLYKHPTDMRKSFDGLCGIIHSQMQKSAIDGSVYIFINKSRNKIKLLHWETGGFTLYYKRLEQGTVERISGYDQDDSVSLKWSELVLIIEGISLKSVQKRKRYSLA